MSLYQDFIDDGSMLRLKWLLVCIAGAAVIGGLVGATKVMFLESNGSRTTAQCVAYNDAAVKKWQNSYDSTVVGPDICTKYKGVTVSVSDRAKDIVPKYAFFAAVIPGFLLGLVVGEEKHKA